MSWRFRRSFRVIPGVKLNLSKRGLSCSIGGAPLTLNVGPRGVYGTASIPGTGISLRHRFGSGSEPSSSQPLPSSSEQPSSRVPSAVVPEPPVQEIHSGSTELLTSESLRELKNLIQTAYQEREEISG